ncbi:hypothetical protein NL676_007965 [Syzygium grande]|nr:hypothetical protein NL676_007965 [Syzygium grande]
MDNAYWWRPPVPSGSGGGWATGAALDGGDWRDQLPPESRERIVNKIMETLKRHLPVSGPEGLQELHKIAVRFEGKIYTAATSQSDYLRKISLKMLTMETKSQSTIPNAVPSHPAGNSCEDSGKRARISPSNQDETGNSSSLDRWLLFAVKHDIKEVKAHGDLIKGLLKGLHHVTKLVMGSWCLKVLSLMEAREVFLPSLKCRHLMLLGAADHEGVPVVAKILESTPHLEKLFLQITCTPNSSTESNAESVHCRDLDGEEFWNSAKWKIYQCLMHLKHVEIIDRGAHSVAWEPVLSLLKFLLQNALWLDKIVINSTNSESSRSVDPWGLLEVARILLSHPKCSPNTKVILRYPSLGCPSKRVRKS